MIDHNALYREHRDPRDYLHVEKVNSGIHITTHIRVDQDGPEWSLLPDTVRIPEIAIDGWQKLYSPQKRGMYLNQHPSIRYLMGDELEFSSEVPNWVRALVYEWRTEIYRHLDQDVWWAVQVNSAPITVYNRMVFSKPLRQLSREYPLVARAVASMFNKDVPELEEEWSTLSSIPINELVSRLFADEVNWPGADRLARVLQYVHPHIDNYQYDWIDVVKRLFSDQTAIDSYLLHESSRNLERLIAVATMNVELTHLLLGLGVGWPQILGNIFDARMGAVQTYELEMGTIVSLGYQHSMAPAIVLVTPEQKILTSATHAYDIFSNAEGRSSLVRWSETVRNLLNPEALSIASSFTEWMPHVCRNIYQSLIDHPDFIQLWSSSPNQAALFLMTLPLKDNDIVSFLASSPRMRSRYVWDRCWGGPLPTAARLWMEQAPLPEAIELSQMLCDMSWVPPRVARECRPHAWKGLEALMAGDDNWKHTLLSYSRSQTPTATVAWLEGLVMDRTDLEFL